MEVCEPQEPFENFDDKILETFNGKSLSAKEILEKSKLDWTQKNLPII